MNRFYFTDSYQNRACCGLTVGHFQQQPICIFSELNSNPGGSVANSATHLVELVRQTFSLPAHTRYFEHYQWPNEMPNISEMLVTWEDKHVTLLEWQVLPLEQAADFVRFVTFFELDYEDSSASHGT